MLVQFERPLPPVEDLGSDEDENIEVSVEREPTYIGVNPKYVSFVFGSREPDVTIIKGPDGRGFKVKGAFAEVHEKLLAAGMVGMAGGAAGPQPTDARG